MVDKSDFEDDPELSELKEQTQRGARTEDESPVATTVDKLVRGYEAVDEGEQSKSISTYDHNLAALLAAVEGDDTLRREVHADLCDALDRDADEADASKTEILRLAAQLGFRSGAPDVWESLKQARQEHVSAEF